VAEESVAEKPMFPRGFQTAALHHFRERLFEWTGEKGDKQPHLFTAADGSPILAFAVLWDRWLDPATDRGTAFLRDSAVSGASDWMITLD
jgi:putative SOS response-associated peptidase YedK